MVEFLLALSSDFLPASVDQLLHTLFYLAEVFVLEEVSDVLCDYVLRLSRNVLMFTLALDVLHHV